MGLDPIPLEVGDGEEPGSPDQTPQQAQQGRLSAWIREVVETLLLAGIIWGVVSLTTARFVVEGPSMEPNIHTGEYVIVTRLAYDFRIGNGSILAFKDPQRGDVIVFHSPLRSGEELIKRIVGLPGDQIEILSGQIFVNGTRLEENIETLGPGKSGFWTVGADQYFVVGDNRNNSSDSRNWGNLDRDLIVGKAWLVYWPPREWGLAPHQTF